MPFKKIDDNVNWNVTYFVGRYAEDGNFDVYCARKTLYGWVTSCGMELDVEPTYYQEIYLPPADDKPNDEAIDFDMTAWITPDEWLHINEIIKKNGIAKDYCIGSAALECLYYLDKNTNLVISNDLSKPTSITVTEKTDD